MEPMGLFSVDEGGGAGAVDRHGLTVLTAEA
jgi:hypothetical protein